MSAGDLLLLRSLWDLRLAVLVGIRVSGDLLTAMFPHHHQHLDYSYQDRNREGEREGIRIRGNTINKFNLIHMRRKNHVIKNY